MYKIMHEHDIYTHTQSDYTQHMLRDHMCSAQGLLHMKKNHKKIMSDPDFMDLFY
jgi:hypothetical protein